MRSKAATLSLAFFLFASGVAFGAAKKSSKNKKDITTTSHTHKSGHHAMQGKKKNKK
jgi:hypothetical protein